MNPRAIRTTLLTDTTRKLTARLELDRRTRERRVLARLFALHCEGQPHSDLRGAAELAERDAERARQRRSWS